MKRKLLIIAVCGVSLMGQAQSLEACQQAARQNYPLIKQYDLIFQRERMFLLGIT